MKRREFIQAITFASVAGPLLGGCAGKLAAASIDTSEVRRSYLSTMLQRLCGELGPHPTESPAMKEAATILFEDMKSAIPTAELHEYTFEGWTLDGEPRLMVGGTEVEVCPHFGNTATAAEGARGTLVRSVDGISDYNLVDESSGDKLVDLRVSPYGMAIPGGPYDGPIPRVGVGRQDALLLDAAVTDKTPVHASSDLSQRRV